MTTTKSNIILDDIGTQQIITSVICTNSNKVTYTSNDKGNDDISRYNNYFCLTNCVWSHLSLPASLY